jgi:hypothetical protein
MYRSSDLFLLRFVVGEEPPKESSEAKREPMEIEKTEPQKEETKSKSKTRNKTESKKKKENQTTHEEESILFFTQPIGPQSRTLLSLSS